MGQILAGLLVATSGCLSPARPSGATAPELVIPHLGADGGTSLVEGEGARFGHLPATVGKTWKVDLRATSRSLDSADAGGAEQVSGYESTYLVEVLEVAALAPSRVRIRFLRNVRTYQGQPTPTEIDGKEYIVDARPPHVRDGADAAASPADTERVLDIFADVGTRARIDEVLPDVPLPLGARHDDLAGAILRVIHPRAWALRAGTATLGRVEGDHARFLISLDASSTSGLRLTVAGDARIRLRDAQLSELSLDGRYDHEGLGATDPPGTFELRRTVTSEREARSGR